MSRYTTWLKEKTLCIHCNCVVSRGAQWAHVRTPKHINALPKLQ